MTAFLSGEPPGLGIVYSADAALTVEQACRLRKVDSDPLYGRIIRVDPFDPSNSKDKWAMITSRNTTTVGKYGLHPGRTIFGDAERTQEEGFLHDGIHQSSEERKALGFFGQIRMGYDQIAHQDTYNNAANSYLEPSQ